MMIGTTKRTGAFWGACLIVGLLILLNACPVFGHGAEGNRSILLFDLMAPQTTEPAEILAVGDAYQLQLLTSGAHGDNGCLHLQTGPTRFSWDKAPVLPPSEAQDSTTADKDRKVELSASEGLITPAEVTVGADGTAQATYTAPSTTADVDLNAYFKFRSPSDKEGFKRTGMQIAVRDPRPVDPSIFHVTLELVNTVESRFYSSPDAPQLFQQEIYLRESVDPLRLEFDLNQRMEVVKDSLKAYYRWSSEFIHSAAVAHGTRSGTDTNTELVDWRISVKRHLNPIKDEPALMVFDASQEELEIMSLFPLPITPSEDMLEIDYYVVIPAPVEGEYNVLGFITPMNGQTHKSYSDIVRFAYDYRKKVTSGKLSNPPQEIWMVKIVKDEISYTMELKDVKFEFIPSESPSVVIGEENYSGNFEYVLFWREWKAPIDVDKMQAPRISPYQLSRAWTEGGDGWTGGHGGVRKLLAEIEMYDRQDKPAVRILREYLAAVKGFPEFGYWYGVMTLESSPDGRYDVKIYAPIKIDAAGWLTIKNSTAPYRDENSAGEPVRQYAN